MALPPGLPKTAIKLTPEPNSKKDVIHALKVRDDSPPRKKKALVKVGKPILNPKATFRLFSERLQKFLGTPVSFEKKKLEFKLEKRFIAHLDGMTPGVTIDELWIYQVVGEEKTRLFRLNLNEVHAQNDLEWQNVDNVDEDSGDSEASYHEASFNDFLKTTHDEQVECNYQANDDEQWIFNFTVDRGKARFFLNSVVFKYTPRKTED